MTFVRAVDRQMVAVAGQLVGESNPPGAAMAAVGGQLGVGLHAGRVRAGVGLSEAKAPNVLTQGSGRPRQAYLYGLAIGTRGKVVGEIYGWGGIGSFPEAIVVDVPEYCGPEFYLGQPTWVLLAQRH